LIIREALFINDEEEDDENDVTCTYDQRSSLNMPDQDFMNQTIASDAVNDDH